MAEGRNFEVIIIGGGIAGASLAYFLAARGMTDVALLERETQHGYHSTGRSAASLVEWDSIPAVQRLKGIGGKFLRHPPAEFSENPLLDRSQVMILFRDGKLGDFEQSAAGLTRDGVEFQSLMSRDAVARVPALAPGDQARALLLTDDGRIDVHELLTSYLRGARSSGVVIRTGAEVRSIIVEGGRCRGVATGQETLRARIVVDAAGAWAGEIATLAGAEPIQLEPRRRSIVLFDPPPDIAVRGWPFVISEADQVYFAPESGGLMLSPMDQVAMAPCDAQPDDEIIAAALERLRALAPRLVPRSLKRKWAGLRTFSPDSVPVVGEDPRVPGFFWLAGQAGFGIESSPAIGQIAADLIARGATSLFDAAILSPTRFSD
ncbi:MAG TPA: FAD-binding oxidoreductase [Candidatus Binataceae bacterium]|nr:FAD-binding oxidoreductase [Candidatus Binataceae bacterium]